MLPKEGPKLSGQLWVEEIGRGQVDRDHEVLVECAPALKLLDRAGEYGSRDMPDSAGPLGEGNEGAGREDSALRMIPVREGLEAHNRSGQKVDARLVVKEELPPLGRLLQRTDELQLLGIVRIDGWAVRQQPHGPLLRGVDRDLGVLEQRLRILCVLREVRDADRRIDRNRRAADDHRRLDPGAYSFREGGDLLVALVLDDDRELVSAQPGEQRTRAHDDAQACRGLDEDDIAGFVAEGVVDLTEAVEVDLEDREAPVPPSGALDGVRQALDEVRPVREPGELVEECLRVDLVDLSSDAFGHAAEQRHEHEEEREQERFEHRTDPELGVACRLVDRIVRLDDQRGSADVGRSHGRVRLERFLRFGGRAARGVADAADDGPGRGLRSEFGRGRGAYRAAPRRVRHESVPTDEQDVDDALRHGQRAEEPVELGAPVSRHSSSQI